MQLFLKDEGYFDRSHKDGTRKVLRVFKMPREWRVHEKKKRKIHIFSCTIHVSQTVTLPILFVI